jgi:hypothetical protein
MITEVSGEGLPPLEAGLIPAGFPLAIERRRL